MSPEKQKILYDKYPQLFSNKDKSIKESCMGWGIEVNGDGWYEILSSLCFMIKQHEDNNKSQKEWNEKRNQEIKDSMRISIVYDNEYYPVKFDQIKEKYGGLRIYFSGGDEYIDGLISMAESFSYQVCELCGEKGKPNKGGWISTLCEKCRNKDQWNPPEFPG